MEIIYLAITVVSLLATILAVRSKRLWERKYRDAIDEATKSTPSTEELKPQKTKPSPADLMKQYEMMVDVYKFHFDIVLKFITFYYAITGAILSFYMRQTKTSLVMNFAALALPIIMGSLFGFFALFGAKQVDAFTSEICEVTDHLHLKPFPNEDLLARLKLMLVFTGLLSFSTAVGLVGLAFIR